MTPQTSPAWKPEYPADLTGVAATIVFSDFPSQSILSSCSHYPYTGHHSGSTNQADLDAMYIQDHSWDILLPSISFEANASSTLDLAQERVSQAASDLQHNLTQVPVMSSVQISGETLGYSASESSLDHLSISRTTNPNFPITSLGQNIEGCFRGNDPCTSPVLDVPSWDAGQLGPAFASVDPCIPNFADPAVWIGDNNQTVYSEPEVMLLYGAATPVGQHLILSSGPVCRCEWQDGDGMVCGEAFTLEKLPGHLSKHGIKKMSRNSPTKCNWVGCRKKRTMNRESIVRHIREVHMGLRRSPRRRQSSVRSALDRRVNTI